MVNKTGNMIIEFLKQHNFPETEINALENFVGRDGFEKLEDKDFEKVLAYFAQYPQDFEDIVPILTDNNSNYLCVYFQGNNKGDVCYLSHDNMNLSSRYKSIVNLIDVINNNLDSWDFQDLPESSFDY